MMDEIKMNSLTEYKHFLWFSLVFHMREHQVLSHLPFLPTVCRRTPLKDGACVCVCVGGEVTCKNTYDKESRINSTE